MDIYRETVDIKLSPMSLMYSFHAQVGALYIKGNITFSDVSS